MRYSIAFLFALITFSVHAQYHNLRLPQSSYKVEQMQTLGLTGIKVIYHSPAVNGREIWGSIVPYESDIPWRGGANINTIIQFSTEVTIEGKPLKAGSYGLHWKVSENGPWTLILSNNDNVWGSYYYRESEDALRVEVNPVSGNFRNRLRYEFSDMTEDEVTIAMEWENKSVPFRVGIDFNGTVVADLRKQLRGHTTNAWEAWASAASFCVRRGVNLEEALEWANRAIEGGYGGYGGKTNFTTLYTKARVLQALGRTAEARQFYNKSGEHLSERGDYSDYANHLIRVEKKVKEGLKLLEKNVELHPDHYLAHRALASAYRDQGMYSKALKSAEAMLKLTPPEYKVLFARMVADIRQKMNK